VAHFRQKLLEHQPLSGGAAAAADERLIYVSNSALQDRVGTTLTTDEQVEAFVQRHRAHCADRIPTLELLTQQQIKERSPSSMRALSTSSSKTNSPPRDQHAVLPPPADVSAAAAAAHAVATSLQHSAAGSGSAIGEVLRC
jgi:hypothetical protein